MLARVSEATEWQDPLLEQKGWSIQEIQSGFESEGKAFTGTLVSWLKPCSSRNKDQKYGSKYLFFITYSHYNNYFCPLIVFNVMKTPLRKKKIITKIGIVLYSPMKNFKWLYWGLVDKQQSPPTLMLQFNKCCCMHILVRLLPQSG